MPISPARAAAFDVLLRVERNAAYASELLHSAAYADLSRRDHALATELVMGVIRWRSRLDAEIAGHSSQPLAKLDLEILVAVRLALYQFRRLNRIPAPAALHDSVELVKRARKSSAASFVNAVLRKLSTQPQTQQNLPQGNSPEFLARELAHPEWLVRRWADSYGLETAEKICLYNQSIPATMIRLRKTAAESKLKEDGLILSPGRILRSARRLQAGDITKTRAFRAGELVIQDEGSQLVAALAGMAPLDAKVRILDCCAAPGGKTTALADRNPNASITAIELHPHRAALLQRLVKTAHSDSRIQVIAADATCLPVSARFERILVDVPCSGTGTLARNPEIKWRIKPADLAELQIRQIAILRSALHHLAPGGRLIFSTCSLEKEENEDVVEQALNGDLSVRLVDCRAELERLKAGDELVWTDTASLTLGPFLRTIPGVHPCDGFFAAIFERM